MRCDERSLALLPLASFDINWARRTGAITPAARTVHRRLSYFLTMSALVVATMSLLRRRDPELVHHFRLSFGDVQVTVDSLIAFPESRK